MGRLTTRLSFVLIAFLIAAGCAPTPQPGVAATAAPDQVSAGKPKVLGVGIRTDIINLHPAQLAFLSDRGMAAMSYSGLVRFKFPGTQIAPDVADTWERAADGKTYTFHLRKNVQFQKGYGELTSADVKFTIEYHKDKANKSRLASLYDVVQSVEAPDPYTVVFKLSAPQIGFLETLAWQNGFIMSKRAVQELGDKLITQPVGSGPFELTTWNKGQEIVFSRFEKHFGEKPQVSEVRYKIIPDEVTQILSIGKGELDVAYLLAGSSVRVAKQTAGVRLILEPGNGVTAGLFNCQSSPTANAKLRQALMYAVDFKAMADASDGMLKTIPTVLNPFIFGYSEDVPKYTYDPSRARALMAEAGYAGEPISIVYTATSPLEFAVLIIKDSWAKVGINAQLEKLDSAVYTAQGAAGKFGIWITAIGRNTPDEYLSAYVRTGAPTNFGKCSDTEVDRLISDARIQGDETKAKQMYAEVQRRLMTLVPIMPVGLQSVAWVVNPKIQNFTFDLYPSIADFQRVRVAD